ncbi:protein pxr1-like [Pitangus sulphuratus]|nr:protein pxr1-like [Pitangus sulphuratus]
MTEMDSPLAKDEPTSDGGRASGMTYLRRGKKPLQQQMQLEIGVRLCERRSSADAKVSKEGVLESTTGAGAEIPLQPVVKMMVRQPYPTSPWKYKVHLRSVGEPLLKRVDAPKYGCECMGSLCWSRRVDPWREETMLE